MQASAASYEYTSVLEDLQKDTTFDVNSYPVIENDYSLDVIQISESVNGELFVYVYQPCAPSKLLEATTIRMATPILGAESTWHDYDLTLLSSSGVFHKYRVEDFEVAKTRTRYYDITAIHRLWIKGIDAPADTETDQTINEVAFPIAKIYRADTDDAGFVSYYHESDVVTVTAKVVGYIYYQDPSFWSKAACDRHIVAFSVDREIDKLYEVDVEYTSIQIADGWYQEKYIYGGTPIGDFVENSKTVYADKDIVYDENGIFVDSHFSFKEIMSTKDFIDSTSDVNYKNGAKGDLETTDYVLTFDVTSVVNYGTTLTQYTNFGKYRTSISNVTIIRLKFEVGSKMYNLGVVDNKQTGSGLGEKPKYPEENGCQDVDWKVVLIIAVIALFVILFIDYAWFRKFVFSLLKYALAIATWPIWLIALIWKT